MREEQCVVQGLVTTYYFLEPKNKATNVVIFLHGWGSSKEVWKFLMQSLDNGYTAVYALDLPGFGKTDGPGQVWGISNYATFVCDFMKKMSISSATIVGHSFGGRTGIVLAATEPTLVKKLILIDSAGFHTSTKFKKLLSIASKFVRPFFRLRWTQPLRKKIYRAIGAEDYVATPELNKTFVRVIGQDLTALVKKITQPVLILWGENDLVTPISYAHAFDRLLPNSKLVILPHAGHYSFLDDPTTTTQTLKEFLA